MRAHGHRAVDAPVDVHREFHAEGRGDRHRLAHHLADQPAHGRVRAHVLQRCVRQYAADRVEGDVAPQLEPDVVADFAPHGRLETGRAQGFAQRDDAG